MLQQSDWPNFTILSAFIIVFTQKKMAIAQSFIIYAVISFLVHSLTPYCYILRLFKVFFLLLLSYFQLPYCSLMGIRFSSSCVFIFYIVFSLSFCLLQMFVIRGNYLIEKKDQRYVIRTFTKAKNSVICANTQWGQNSIYPNGKDVFPNLLINSGISNS